MTDRTAAQHTAAGGSPVHSRRLRHQEALIRSEIRRLARGDDVGLTASAGTRPLPVLLDELEPVADRDVAAQAGPL